MMIIIVIIICKYNVNDIPALNYFSIEHILCETYYNKQTNVISNCIKTYYFSVLSKLEILNCILY